MISTSPPSGQSSTPKPRRFSGSRRLYFWLLAGALLAGSLVRLPGVFWGSNFPGGWQGHHPDEYTHLVNAEMILEPSAEPRWPPNPYPKGLAGLVAAPVIAVRAATGGGQVFSAPPPSIPTLMTLGRLVSVLMGVATILLVWATARRLFRDPRIALAAAWFTALGGLHVTQSHFFVSDVPAVFALLLGLYLLLVDLQSGEEKGVEAMRWAALAFGAAFGLKFFVAGLPSLALIAVWRRPRWRRILHAAVFFIVGLVVVNLGYFTPWDFYNAFAGGTTAQQYQFSRWISGVLYLIESPVVMGLPFAVLAAAGTIILARKLWSARRTKIVEVVLVILLPAILQLGPVVLLADHFPRHLVPFIPWAAMAAGWALIRGAERVGRGRHRVAWVAVPVFAYMTVFVVDGERAFIQDPRNQAAEWLLENVEPGTPIWWNRHGSALPFEHQRFPEDGRPEYVVIEMLDANHYLRGVSLRNTRPRDVARIFGSRTQDRVDALQGLFTGESGYERIARFQVGYFMPEYVWTNALIGDRSRSYVTEIVLFRRASPGPPSTESG